MICIMNIQCIDQKYMSKMDRKAFTKDLSVVWSYAHSESRSEDSI